MIKHRRLTQLLTASALWLAACASGGVDPGTKNDTDRDRALEVLQISAGAPVSLEANEDGVVRVLDMSPRFALQLRATDPAQAAQSFLATHHDVFDLSADDAASFVVTRTDVEPNSGHRHITLQRTFDGIPVFQGAVTVHMNPSNGVYRAVADEFYRVTAPTNRQVLSAGDAASAAARALGLDLAPTLASSEGLRTSFTAAGTLDPITVEPRIFQVSAADNRFAYQVVVAWLDPTGQQQMDLVLVDAHDGAMLASHSLVNTFTGRVFVAGPGANPTTDTRVVVSFDGNPTASPSGWVDATRKTRGNNANAATDIDGTNTIGANETQPTANAADAFDFPFSPLQNAGNFKDAAVTSAFYLVNDFHDRTYAYGFTEAAGNFQLSNFGKGGAQNDEVQVDAQDRSATNPRSLNNANFGTPPDGSRPRMQMFLFTINGGAEEDGDFDPGVIYHENAHGLSNRLVGGGSTACLNGTQSGGMGEGWGDFIGGSFLNDPVVGAYVTGNATRGIRQAAMNASPFTYANIKDGTMTQVHNAGEIWAATLFDIRKVIGAAKIEQLVVTGMKLTPCNPTMLQARDAIIQADVNLNAGANRCALFTAFAGRQMGTGASSANHNSTSTIVLSTAVPPDCGGGGGGVTRNFTSTDVPKAIPDNNATGVRSVLTVPAGATIQRVTVDTNISHTFRGDLVIQVVSPSGQVATLSNRAGGSADNFLANGTDITASFTAGASSAGTWQLFVRDLAAVDVGRINSFVLHVTSPN
jgi:extracellular elastinolytic metalloproteinase